MNIFRYAFDAIFPLVLLIGVGYLLRRIGLLDESFFRKCRTLAFYVAIPINIFCCIYSIKSLSSINWRFLIFSFLAVLLLFFIGTICAFLLPDRRQRGVIVQCAYRTNYNTIAVPLAEALGGSAGLTAASVLCMTIIPEFNILAVISLSMFMGSVRNSLNPKKVLHDLLRNPLVIASLLALLCLVIRSVLPTDSNGDPVFSISGSLPAVYSALNSISRMAAPLALITLGGLFRFQRLKGHPKALTLGVLLRLIVAPVVGLGAAWLAIRLGLLTINSGEFACLVAVFASPAASACGVMAAQMGNDDELADQLVVLSSLFSTLTVFAAVCLLRFIGLI